MSKGGRYIYFVGDIWERYNLLEDIKFWGDKKRQREKEEMSKGGEIKRGRYRAESKRRDIENIE